MSKTLIKSLFYSLFAVLLLSAKCGQPSFSDANNRYKVKEYAVAADMYTKVYKNAKSTKKKNFPLVSMRHNRIITITIIKML